MPTKPKRTKRTPAQLQDVVGARSKPSVIWCSCGNWYYGGQDELFAHMAAHQRHQWWPEGAYPPPYGPHWPQREDCT